MLLKKKILEKEKESSLIRYIYRKGVWIWGRGQEGQNFLLLPAESSTTSEKVCLWVTFIICTRYYLIYFYSLWVDKVQPSFLKGPLDGHKWIFCHACLCCYYLIICCVHKNSKLLLSNCNIFPDTSLLLSYCINKSN